MRSLIDGSIMSLFHCGVMVIRTLHFNPGMLSIFCLISNGIESAAGQKADVKLIKTKTYLSLVTLTSYINPNVYKSTLISGS